MSVLLIRSTIFALYIFLCMYVCMYMDVYGKNAESAILASRPVSKLLWDFLSVYI